MSIQTIERWGKWNGEWKHITIDITNNKIYLDGVESEENQSIVTSTK